MKQVKKLAVIGLGGIGSFLCRALKEAFVKGYEGIDLDSLKVDVMDMDTVEEKNLSYTIYDIEHLDVEKASAIASLYKFSPKNERLTNPAQLKGYDFVIMCVDNNEVRNILLQSGIEFLDLRATGRQVFATWVDETTKQLYEQNTKDDGSKGSCQYAVDLETKNIQRGNVIVAEIGMQMFLNKFRGDSFRKEWSMIF